MNPQGVSHVSSKVGWLTREAGTPATTNLSGQQQEQAGGGGKKKKQQQTSSSSAALSGAAAASSSGDGFSSFGLDHALVETLHNVLHFTNPTPIQRKAIPLLMQGADVVAMARTGSGKTAAFCLPMIQRLKEHAPVVGMRSVIFSPTRELALQTLRHFRMLAKHTNLRSTAITGGDGLNAQFESLAENPDLVVSSPGRLLHVIEEVKQNLLARVQVCVLDEADRLFELGFQAQIHALMKRIPERAQRCLFSATMPSILAEFTEAGLHNPIVVRLDSEMKLSSTLKNSTFVVRTEEKAGALVYLLMNVIGVPSHIITTNVATAEVQPRRLNPVAAARNKFKKSGKQKKGGGKNDGDDDDDDDDDYDEEDETYQQQQVLASAQNNNLSVPGGFNTDKQVLVFVESKYHVEFFGEVLPQCYGVKTVAIHGAMDQQARKENIALFRKKEASVLIVTDVAARGIDLPTLDYVINFSFPHEPKLFVHRVGRVARAGRAGTAFSIITSDDMPYYFDCMQFIGKTPLCRRPEHLEDQHISSDMTFTPDDGCYGRIPAQTLSSEVDTLNKLISESVDLKSLFETTQRAHGKYTRTKKRATITAMRAAHDDELLRYENIPVHPMLDDKLSQDMRSHHAALNELRKFKAKETLLDMIHGGPVFDISVARARKLQQQQQQLSASGSGSSDAATAAGGSSNNSNGAGGGGEMKTGAALLKKLTSDILGGGIEKSTSSAAVAAAANSAEQKKISLADRMSRRADESRRRDREQGGGGGGGDGGGGGGREQQQQIGGGLVMSVRSMFGDDDGHHTKSIAEQQKDQQRAKQRQAKKDLHKSHNSLVVDSAAENDADFRDREYFMQNEKQETIDSAHLSLKGHAMDINAESADDAKAMRSVYAWSKNKNRYIKTNVNDAKAMLKGLKNEAGKKIDFKTKLDAYRNWTKSSNMRVQDIGEEEDLTALRTAQTARKTGEAEQAAYRAGLGSNVDALGGDDDYDPSLLDDPAHQRKARIGRKMKKLPSQGRVKTFDQMALERRRKKKDAAKLEARRARKAGKKRSS